MGKIKKLLKFNEAKQVITIVLDQGKFTLFGDAGSREFSEKGLIKLLGSIKLSSLDVKKSDIKSIIKFVKDDRDNQADLQIDDKDIRKLGLK